MTGPWWSLLSYTAFLTYLALAVVVLRRGPRSALNWSCALFLLALACWSLEDVFHGNPALAEGYVRTFSHIGTLGRASGGSLFLWFVLLLTRRERLLRRRWLYPLLIGAPVAFAVGLWTGAFPAVAQLHSFGWVVFWPSSVWSVAYYGYLVLAVTIAVGLLWQARQQATEPNVRRRLGLIIATTILAFLLAVLFDVVLSSLPNSPILEFGSSLALIWAVGLTVSMTRHGLLAVEPERAARETLATIPDAVLLLGADGRISSANPALSGLTGRPVEATIGRPVTELFTHPELAAEELAETWVAQRRRTFALECRSADGSTVPVSVKAQAIRAGKRLVGAVWILHDERDRVQAELARRVSAENYRSFVQNFAGIAFEAELDFRIRFLHGAVREITGYDAAEFESGRVRWRDIIHPDDIPRLRAGTTRLRTAPNCTVVRDYRIIRQDGSIGWVQERLWNVTGPDGQPVRIHGTVTDVTEQRRTMEELAALNRFRASIIDNANILLVVVDPQMRVVVWNKAAQRITGYQEAEAVGRLGIWRLFPDEGERRRLQAENRPFIEQGLARSNIDAPIVCADGLRREVNWTFQPIVGPDGKLSNFVMLGEDVTELRQAQREHNRHLRDLTLLAQTAMELTDIAPEADIYGLVAERLQQLTGAVLVFVNTFDAATNLLTVRAAFGLDPKQATGLIGQPPLGFTIRIDAERRELLRSGTLVPIPGGLRQVGVSVLPDFACQVLEQFYGLGQAYAIGFVWPGELVGNAIILLPAGSEITDPSAVEALVRQAASALRRRAAEAALRESEQRYRAVVENAGDGIAIVQDGLVVYANPSLCRLAGREPAEVVNRPFTEFLAAESRATVLDYYQRRMAGEAVPTDYQVVLGFADLRANVEISARVINYGGRPADLVVVRGAGFAARSASATSHQKPDR